MNWERFQEHARYWPELGFGIDISRMAFPGDFFDRMEPAMQRAFGAMRDLENGAVANPDENRQVGHYWLRAPERAPDEATAAAIRECLERIRSFAASVHSGATAGQGGPFENVLVIGIGGSALGPQFAADALGAADRDKLRPFFMDNTDPDGFDRVLAQLRGRLDRTLTLVVSKSGGTAETRNGMIEARAAYEAARLDFARHAAAITGEGSRLDDQAAREGWLARFPMWDWVGGRTSELAAVGLLPAALQGLDIDALSRGAAEMDEQTRQADTRRNPAALLALMWHFATEGKGKRDMVMLPYKDRLTLFSKYLQQLVMESLGKERDLDGNVVNQGITVYGNKGSTDQHAYVQQLREGVENFFVTFIEVLRDRRGPSPEIEEGAASGDFLQGFLLGTRDALHEKGRQSITLTIDEVSPETVGRLIALFERAVGLYASLVNINAYHQPGVEAGKKAAAEALDVERRAVAALRATPDQTFTAEEIARHLNLENRVEWIFKLLFRLSKNEARGVRMEGATPMHAARFFASP